MSIMCLTVYCNRTEWSPVGSLFQKSTKYSTLDVGEDKLVLHVNPNKYHLDLDLPFNVNNETCGAQYNRKTKVGLVMSHVKRYFSPVSCR